MYEGCGKSHISHSRAFTNLLNEKVWSAIRSPLQRKLSVRNISFLKIWTIYCSEGDWVPFSAMSWAWMKDSNHFSGLTSAFRAAYEQSNLKVGLISAFDRHRSLKVGLISAFDRHTCINRSISADHALAHALEFGGEWRNLKKVSSTCISL